MGYKLVVKISGFYGDNGDAPDDYVRESRFESEDRERAFREYDYAIDDWRNWSPSVVDITLYEGRPSAEPGQVSFLWDVVNSNK